MTEKVIDRINGFEIIEETFSGGTLYTVKLVGDDDKRIWNSFRDHSSAEEFAMSF